MLQFRKDRKRKDLGTGAFAIGKISLAIAEISEAFLEVYRKRVVDKGSNALVFKVAL